MRQDETPRGHDRLSPPVRYNLPLDVLERAERPPDEPRELLMNPLDPESAKFAFLIRFRDLFPGHVEELNKELGYGF